MKIGKAEASQGTSRSLKLLGKLVPLGTRGQSRGSLKELGSAMQTDPAGSETHTSCFFDCVVEDDVKIAILLLLKHQEYRCGPLFLMNI